jgi:hypothetical protein
MDIAVTTFMFKFLLPNENFPEIRFGDFWASNVLESNECEVPPCLTNRDHLKPCPSGGDGIPQAAMCRTRPMDSSCCVYAPPLGLAVAEPGSATSQHHRHALALWGRDSAESILFYTNSRVSFVNI